MEETAKSFGGITGALTNAGICNGGALSMQTDTKDINAVVGAN